MIKKFAIILFGLVATSFQLSQQSSLPSDSTYNAGVVEFKPNMNGTSTRTLWDNLERIKSIIESDETKDLDILVFPEYVLNDMESLTYVPDPKDKIIPCEVPDYDWFLSELSCAARSRKLYVVVNVMEKYSCSSTEEECLKKYNTNVVFDRDGRVISRYRKTHLYRTEWYKFDVLPQPELATFSTDFGVTFGHFICFDMLFYEPAQVLIRQLNITDIIFSTFWFSELPFSTGVSLQEGWAFGNNVNLLAAGASYPKLYTTGSGIYAGRLGRLAAFTNEYPTTVLLKAKVPKRRYAASYQLPPPVVKPSFVPTLESKRYTKLKLLRDYNVDIFNTTLLDDSFVQVDESVCHHSFCCSFHVRRVKIADSSKHTAYRYRLAAYSGSQTTFHRIDSSNQSVCALIACTGTELFTCGYTFPANVLVGNKYYFSAINITGNFVESDRRLIMPSTVNSTMLPLTVDSYEWVEKNNSSVTNVRMSLTEPQQDLLTFGIWANYYSTVKNTHNLKASTSAVEGSVSGAKKAWNYITSLFKRNS